MKRFKSRRGITLIALVVTIVVLLILAAVSISMLGGENGIITQAQNAKLESRAGEVEEEVNLWKSEKISSKYTNATVKTEDELLEEMKTDKILFEDEIDRENKLITIGTREISYKLDEEINVGKEALIFLVNSGTSGIVGMPIAIEDYGKYQIDWGDKTTGIDSTLIGENGVKVASKDDIYIADAPYAICHTYKEKNKEYIVTITGKCDFIQADSINCTKEKILEVLQWGETGLGWINLSYCNNLRKIASPTENSFVNIEDFSGAFSGCTSLTSIPENLFANCLNVQSFESTFYGCTSLTSLPENLFANCNNIQDFSWCFYGCTNLEENAPELWLRVENGIENDFIGIPDGQGCFGECFNLINYEQIPQYWKILN